MAEKQAREVKPAKEGGEVLEEKKAEAEEKPKEEAPKAEEKKKKPAEKPKPEAKAPEKPADPEPKEEPKPVKPAEKPKKKSSILLFNRWDLSEVKVEDAGLVKYINIKPIIIPRTGGKFTSMSVRKHHASIVERLINKLMVPGHRGKKHKITSGYSCGNTQTITLAVKEALEIIEKRAKQNPVQVLVKAMENASPLEEVAAYRMGGMIARKAVVISPQRRLDLALRHLAQGSYKAGFRSGKSLANVVAAELMAAASNDAKCFAISERMRHEKEAEGAR